MLTDGLERVDYCDVLSAVWSHSDGTHSLKSIPGERVMQCYISPNLFCFGADLVLSNCFYWISVNHCRMFGSRLRPWAGKSRMTCCPLIKANVMFSDHVYHQASTDTQMRKLEELLCDANTRNEDLQKTVNEVTAAKNRLTGDRWRSDVNTGVTTLQTCGLILTFIQQGCIKLVKLDSLDFK